MRAFAVVLGALSMVAGGSQALAEERHGNLREARNNYAESQRNRTSMVDDARDLREILRISEQWHRARSTANRASERSADAQLHHWLQKELHESERDVHAARTELRQSKAEVRRSRREAANNLRYHHKDRRDLRDDRRDRRDDRRDMKVAARDLKRTHEIAAKLRKMEHAFAIGSASPKQYRKKSKLLQELVSMARAEVARNHEEAREDAREHAEDVRERREDRRQARRRLRHVHR